MARNQGWHLVYGPTPVSMDVGGDTQLTDVWELVYRMQGQDIGDPGAQVVQYVYGDYNDPSGQKSDGTMPDIVVTTMTAYEIREDNPDRDAEADYLYDSSSQTYPNAESAFLMAGDVARQYATINGDMRFDWNGESVMYREGGAVKPAVPSEITASNRRLSRHERSNCS